MVEITFYHRAHIQANGVLAHGACNLKYTTKMSLYALCVSQKLKDFTWTQLGLG